jgi:hypothetical protein
LPRFTILHFLHISLMDDRTFILRRDSRLQRRHVRAARRTTRTASVE